ncbi:MAG: FtsX-like permease family protein [Oscillospiraceae bacterium]|nr:FtsX-like permease family protein [Oscillospiraceae bacterium]
MFKKPRTKIWFKTLLRTPVKTAVTFLLIAAASFALFSRVTDYAVTSREMNNVVNFYHGVVALNNNVPDSFTMYHQSKMPGTDANKGWYNTDRPPTPLEAKQIEVISNLPGVALAETRYMTGGVIHDYERFYRYGDINFGFNYLARYIIQGTLAEIDLQGLTCNLYFEDSEVLGGNYPLSEVSAQLAKSDTAPDGISGFSGDVFNVLFRVGERGTSSLSAPNDPDVVYFHNSPYDEEFLEGLEVGKSYTFVGLYSELEPTFTRLGDMDTLHYFNFAETAELQNDPENLQRLNNLADIMEKDLHTFDVVYATDMRAIPRVNEQGMVLQEGRFLVPGDAENKVPVCVVSSYFFEKNNLSLGDKLEIELGDKLFMQHAGMGAITHIPERSWNTLETIEFEIVGVYTDTESPHQRASSLYWTYHPATIFVPMSFLPVEIPADHEVWAGEFSVLIENADGITAFFEAAPPVTDWVSELSWDYTLPHWDWEKDEEIHYSGSAAVTAKWRFSDLGWSRVQGSIATSEMTSLLTALFFTLGAVLASLLAVQLYIGGNKKTYAIMRALGMPRKATARTIAMPFALLSVFGVFVGGVTGLLYTWLKISQSIENLSVKLGIYNMNTTIPFVVIMLCLLGMIGLITLFTVIALRKMSKIPPLILLQGEVIRVATFKPSGLQEPAQRTVNAVSVALPTKSHSPVQSTVSPTSPSPITHRYSAFRHMTRYTSKHMLRVFPKTITSLLLAFVLMGAIGFLAITKLFYTDLSAEVAVVSTTTNFSTAAVEELFTSELLNDDLYYSSDYVVFWGDDTEFAYPLTLTNDFEKTLEALGGNYIIEFAEGYENTDFFKVDSFLANESELCVIGVDFGAKPGDIITLWGSNYTVGIEAVYYKVAGVIKSEFDDLRDIGERIYAPMSGAVLSANMGEHFLINYSEFTLADNEKAPELLVFLDELRNDSRNYSISAEYTTDTTELENIKRVRDLLTLLFPIAVTAAVLIGLTAPALLILQSSKEAAILRVLGTTKKRVRCMLTIEQVALCIIGIILAAGGLLVYNYSLFTQSAETLALCGVLYLLGCVCAGLAASVSVTKRKVLELLQVKE